MKSVAAVFAACLFVTAAGCGDHVDETPDTALKTSTDATQTTKRLNFGENGSAVQLYRWKWQDIMANMGRIRDMGYTTILISPHMSTCAGEFSAGYDPSDFTNFNSGFGTESDLGWLIGTAHFYNLNIYADMPLNHMCPSNYVYPHFSWPDFHHEGGITDFNDYSNRETHDLFGLNDLAQESDYVRSQLWNFVVKSNDLGFDGYRWDAAKHVPLWYWHDHIVGNVNRWGKFNYGEVYSANLDELQNYANSGMAVTDYNLYDAITSAFRFGGDLSRLDGAGYAMRNPSGAVTFVENHDVGAPPNRSLAYAFISAYPGYPFYYGTTIDDPDIRNLVWVHNHKANGTYISRYSSHDILVFERDRSLLAGFNQTDHWVDVWVDSGFRNVALHDYAGKAGDTGTGGDGRVQVSIPPMGWVMLAPN
jgi:alpha-amylase